MDLIVQFILDWSGSTYNKLGIPSIFCNFLLIQTASNKYVSIFWILIGIFIMYASDFLFYACSCGVRFRVSRDYIIYCPVLYHKKYKIFPLILFPCVWEGAPKCRKIAFKRNPFHICLLGGLQLVFMFSLCRYWWDWFQFISQKVKSWRASYHKWALDFLHGQENQIWNETALLTNGDFIVGKVKKVVGNDVAFGPLFTCTHGSQITFRQEGWNLLPSKIHSWCYFSLQWCNLFPQGNLWWSGSFFLCF